MNSGGKTCTCEYYQQSYEADDAFLLFSLFSVFKVISINMIIIQEKSPSSVTLVKKILLAQKLLYVFKPF